MVCQLRTPGPRPQHGINLEYPVNPERGVNLKCGVNREWQLQPQKATLNITANAAIMWGTNEPEAGEVSTVGILEYPLFKRLHLIPSIFIPFRC